MIKKVMLLFMSLFLCSGIIHNTAGAAGTNPISKLGVNDKLSDIEPVTVNGRYYVPLRLLSEELQWSLTGLANGIAVSGNGRSLRLLQGDGGAVLQDGTAVPVNTFLQKGSLMVPLQLSARLGYIITFQPDKYLLRVRAVSAKLTDTEFAAKYQKELKPPVTASLAPRGNSGKPGQTVYLTFDDGPSATTAELLEILGKYKVKATFFMLGQNMNTYPYAVKQTVKEGYGLALHGMTHRKEKFYASPAAALAEMSDANAVLKRIAGASTTLIRPPYGSKPYFTQSFRDKVLNQGYHLWDWNVDSEDWKYKENSDKVYTSVMDQVHKLKKSKISPVILMHDQKATLKVLPRLLETLKKEGYDFQLITKDLRPVNFWKDTR